MLSEKPNRFIRFHSAVDHVFVLESLIGIFRISKIRLQCAVADFQNAFDSVWRHGLMHKLLV